MLERPFETLTAVLAGLAVLLVLIGVAIHRLERRPSVPVRAGAAQATSASRPARHDHLSRQELARLTAFRARARLMAGEPLVAPGWWGEVRQAWREGYAGWILACLAGSFSMATHFGAWWLISGRGWGGAVIVTLISTTVMVSACAWIGLGLIKGR